MLSAPSGPCASISLASEFQTTELAAVHPAACARELSLVSRMPGPLDVHALIQNSRRPALKRSARARARRLAVESRNTLGPAASNPTAKSFMPCSLQHCRTSTCWPSIKNAWRRYPRWFRNGLLAATGFDGHASGTRSNANRGSGEVPRHHAAHPRIFDTIERNGNPRMFFIARIGGVKLTFQREVFDAGVSHGRSPKPPVPPYRRRNGVPAPS